MDTGGSPPCSAIHCASRKQDSKISEMGEAFEVRLEGLFTAFGSCGGIISVKNSV